MFQRIAVIGAGVVGLATAGALAESGHRVTLLEAAAVGSGTSETSFAWLIANSKRPREYHALNLAGMAAYRRMRAEFGELPWLHLTGHIKWAGSTEAQAEPGAWVSMSPDLARPCGTSRPHHLDDPALDAMLPHAPR